MDFTNRSMQQPSATRSSGGASSSGEGHKSSGKADKGMPKWLNILWIVLLFSATILAVALVVLMYFGGNKESDYVDEKKVQAVFLTNGQVYFGTISQVNGSYLDLQNIYYLNVSQQVQPNQDQQQQQAANNVSLVKLGCELHGPIDQMIINRDQVSFWENLKDDGQVAKAIAEWVKQNPNGQKCTTAANNNSDATNDQ